MATFTIPTFDVPHIDDEDLEHATPEEVASYEMALRRALALTSPLDLAEQMYPETRRWDHIELLNDHLVALAEYRLTENGPGLPGTTEIVFNERNETLDSATCLWQPDKLTLPVRVPIVTKLSVSMRPRAGKSRLINQVFPLWLLLHDPDLLVAVGTYSDSFADEWGEEMRDTCIDAHERLPFLPLPAGGRRAARFPIPFEVLMGTRWHHDDVIGYACYDHDDDGARRPSPEWCILNIPAQCEDPDTDPLNRELGEAHPNAAGEGAEFLEKKKLQNPRVYAALYQGRPSPEGGGLIPNVFNTYQVKDDKGEAFFLFEKLQGNTVDGGDEEDRFVTSTTYVKEMIPFTSIDMAATKKTTSDYTVGFNCLYSREHHALFLVDRFRDRITTDEYEKRLIPFASGNGTKKWLVEDVTFGKSFGQTLQRKYKFQVDMYPAVADKVARVVSSTLPDMMSRMQVYVLPTASWLEGTEAEIGNFPYDDHDDIPDALAAAAQFVSDMPRWRPKPEPKEPNLADEIDALVDRQQRKRKRNDPWSRISR